MRHTRRHIAATVLSIIASGLMIADARADFLYVERNDGAIQRIDTLTRAETTFASGLNTPEGGAT